MIRMTLPDRLLCGVSGGADSVALLRLMLDAGKAVRQNTTALAQGAKDNCKIYQRRIR